MKKYIAEFIGTFTLIFVAEGAFLINGITNGSLGLVGIALASGFVLMTLIYSLIHVSGAFFNPAVTITMLIHGRIKAARASGYIISQLGGAGLAGLLLLFLFPGATPAEHYGLPTEIDFGLGIMIEAILTFFLLATIYGAFVNKYAPRGFYGLTIGSVLIFNTLIGGPISGASATWPSATIRLAAATSCRSCATARSVAPRYGGRGSRPPRIAAARGAVGGARTGTNLPPASRPTSP